VNITTVNMHCNRLHAVIMLQFYTPVWVHLDWVCGRHDVALVCTNGLHNNDLLRTCLGGGGFTMICSDTICVPAEFDCGKLYTKVKNIDSYKNRSVYFVYARST